MKRMKNSNSILIIALFTIALSVSSCLDHQQKIAGNYTYETECLGVELDGSQTLRAWGSGRNRSDAIEQAKKNAVRDVLFKGIRAGQPGCEVKPLVPEVNAQEKYSSYFNKFFTDGGEYKKFISSKDGSVLHPEVFKNRKKAGSQDTYRVTIRVLRSELQTKLKEDNIIN